MIKKFLINYVVILITITVLGTIFVVIAKGEPEDLLPLLLGATVAGVPISAYLAWLERS